MAGADPSRTSSAGATPKPPRRQRAIASKTVAAVAIAALLIAFGVANDDRVAVDYLVVSRESPLILVIGVSALLGALAGALIARRRKR
ncbi:MAG: hypothetical protein QOI62_1126 [Solirubrobacteraceae bacterium]|jgi:LPXTG-motif cell wall-anchored protein|nr:hypothetical protein [Solirubrobacteraceae bacterium]MEA2357866.1 hypothetical protein [Solirubrobacteraceae bacterium]